nr:hypothetical protein [Streptococcus equi]
MINKRKKKLIYRYGVCSAAIVLMASAAGLGTTAHAEEQRTIERLKEKLGEFPHVQDIVKNYRGISNEYTTGSIHLYLGQLETYVKGYLNLLNDELIKPGLRENRDLQVLLDQQDLKA